MPTKEERVELGITLYQTRKQLDIVEKDVRDLHKPSKVLARNAVNGAEMTAELAAAVGLGKVKAVAKLVGGVGGALAAIGKIFANTCKTGKRLEYEQMRVWKKKFVAILQDVVTRKALRLCREEAEFRESYFCDHGKKGHELFSEVCFELYRRENFLRRLEEAGSDLAALQA